MIAAIFVVPLVWEILRSFEAPGAIVSPPSLKNFSQHGRRQLHEAPQWPTTSSATSITALSSAIATAAVTAIVATFAGYGFGRFRFRGSGTIFGLVLLGFMVPFQAVIVPLFLELKTFHLLNTLPGLVVFYTAFNLPFGIYLMRNSFRKCRTS